MSPNRLDDPGSRPGTDPDDPSIQILALDVLGDRLEQAASASIVRKRRAQRAPWAWGLTIAPALAVLAAVLLFSAQLAPAADARVIQAADRTAARTTGRFVMTTRLQAPTAGAAGSAPAAARPDLTLKVAGAYDRSSGRLRTTIDLAGVLGAAGGGAAAPSGPGIPGAAGAVETIQDGSMLYLRADLFSRSLPGHPEWVSLDLAKLRSPGGAATGSLADVLGTGVAGGAVVADPADLLDALRGIGADTVVVEQVELDGVATTHYRGTVDLATAAAASGPVESARLREGFAHLGLDAATAVLPMDVWVDEQGEVRRVQTTLDLSRAHNEDGTSMGTGPTVVTTDYLDLGAPEPISVPAANVVDITPMVQGALAGPLGGATPTTAPR
jgi:hypothetical protein